MNRNYTIYAVDFDGTLCESIFPDIGKPNMALIKHLIKRRNQGNKLILWTCRVGERLAEAVEWCRQHGLEFDAVNENLPEMIEHWGNETRKVFADVYIDDKAVNKPKYCVPYRGGLTMREILFKAKRIDNGEWVIGDLSHHKTGKIFIKPLNGSASSSCEVDKDTICQYTGLTDKNGQKIWENDIVKKHFYTDYDNYANSEEYIGFVKFEDCAWVIETKSNNRICTRPIIESMAYSEDIKHFEVIGNIFDNPELLNE